MIRFLALAALGLAAFGAPLAAAQEDPAVMRGRQFARLHCGQCHATEKIGESPLAIAPPLRDLHNNYPVETLEEALAEGIMTGHPTMPQFQLEANEIFDFIAFLKSLEG